MTPHPNFFPETYAQARIAFVDEVRAAGGEISSAGQPNVAGPSGEALVTDVAWFGPRAASRVMVSISGTHGQEFFAGAATQRAWLARGGHREMSADVAVCLVHANNAFGAAHASRTNENNVDPNRNFFDHAAPRRTDPLYAHLHDKLFPPRNVAGPYHNGTDAFLEWCEAHTKEQLVAALDMGQQSHPDGLIYCGVGEEWTTRNLKSIAADHLRNAEKIALIDWHTGIGPFGEATFLYLLEPASDEFRWARTWWGASPNPEPGSSPLPVAEIGYIHSGLAAHLRRKGSTVAGTVIEWGTFDNPSVLGALFIDRWLRFECSDPSSEEAIRLRTIMMERLNPSLRSWQSAVVEKSATIYASTLRGLALWQ